jgi:hypothetical protein
MVSKAAPPDTENTLFPKAGYNDMYIVHWRKSTNDREGKPKKKFRCSFWNNL